MRSTSFSNARASRPRFADLVIRAGTIYSMLPDRQTYHAIALRDEWIVAVSQDPHGLDTYITADTMIIDEPQLTILPAFEDTHNHLILAVQNRLLVPVDQAQTIAEFVALLKAQAAQTLAGDWITTSDAWHEVHLQEGRLPTAPELDEATRDHPILVRRGGHVVVANTLALRLAGITRETPEPEGGTIGRFSDGTPNGVLIEAPAHAPVSRLVPPTTFEQMVEGLKLACQDYHACGLGTVRDPLVTREQMAIYQTLWERGELTLRSRILLSAARGPATVAQRLAAIDGFAVHSGFGDDILKIWGLKLVLDGGAEGGALDEPYEHAPHFRGHLLWSPEDLFQVGNFAVQRGWRIGTHAVGDRAVRVLLDVYEHILQENPGLRPGSLVLEHGFLASAEQRARAIRLGVPITIQHPLLYTLGKVLIDGWGQARTREVMPVRAWLEEGAQLSAGTDYPVGSYHPLHAIWGMVTRETHGVGIQGPEYAIDQYTALQLYTTAGAELDGESHRRGTLQPGRLADLVAFTTDPVTCPVDDLPQLRPVLTMVGGQAVYNPARLLGERS